MTLNNRITRILVSALAIPIILGIAYLGKIPFLIFSLVIGTASYYEFSSMVKSKDHQTNKIFGLLFISILILNAYFNVIEMGILFLIIVLTLMLYELFRNRSSAINNLGSTLIGIVYIGLFTSALVKVREFYSDSDLLYSQGGLIIISVLLTIWVCDSAAYFLGSAFGKHKLFPRVSPNKSWEGAVAGFVFSIITMVVLKPLILDFLNWNEILIIGFLIGIFGQIGDLIESLLKRDAGVKDSSSIIPGHGGIFDRFDSLIFSAPIIYIYLFYFV